MPKAVYLEFTRSDGSPEKWPVDKLDSTPVGGEVNFMRPIAHSESLSLKWRSQVGREVARLLGTAEYDNYILKDFPEGYRFYHHNKGPVTDPRTDPYLFGSSSGRFRSPPEFIPHAYWLLTDDTLDLKNCKCKYCGSGSRGRRQTEISQSLGLRSTAPSTSTPSSTKPKVRQVAQPRRRPNTSGSVINHDRIADLRVSRRFRPGELVWCALSPAIQGQHEHECIEFWPGLVNEARLKSDVLPHALGERWRVIQGTVYKVQLFGVMHSYVLPEDAILPYQAYGPSMSLIERLRIAGNPALLRDRQQLTKLHPVPFGAEAEGSVQLKFVEASTPFALAIQIAAHLVRMWTPTDEWKFHGQVLPQVAAAPSTSSQLAVEINENRHHGLWWGAERIWTEELVRLQPARAQVLPQGSSVIHRASPRADGRGVLLRINSIIAVQNGTNSRDCKVAGVLYELADESYEETASTTVPMDITDSGVSVPFTSSSAPVTPVDTSLQQIHGLGSTGPASSTPAQNGLLQSSQDVPPQSSQVISSQDSAAQDVPSSDSTAQNIPPHNTAPTSPQNLPNITSYALPKPPQGFKFRSIMKDGYEIVLDVSLISGRYYPGLLKHPLLQNTLADVNPDDARVAQLSALCGLLAGAVNSMECVDWAATRLGMIKHADLTAQQDLFQHWHPPNEEQKEGLSIDDVGISSEDRMEI
ncbi:hypothetical protein K439DRAFT_1391266 [Ramaria rubella]|nr:hypothetical protein K439DRAFT_1391266 [Ramaria rubella]